MDGGSWPEGVAVGEVDADSNGNDDFASWQPIALRISPVPARSTADSDFASTAVIPNGTADKRSPIVSGLHSREPLSLICVSLLKAYDTWARRRSLSGIGEVVEAPEEDWNDDEKSCDGEKSCGDGKSCNDERGAK